MCVQAELTLFQERLNGPWISMLPQYGHVTLKLNTYMESWMYSSTDLRERPTLNAKCRLNERSFEVGNARLATTEEVRALLSVG